MTKKVGLFSGKVLKRTGDDLSADRYKWLRLEEAEPDLGQPNIESSLLVGYLDGTRGWEDRLFNTFAPDPDTGDEVLTFTIDGNIQVNGNINGIIEVDVSPTSLNLPDGAIIKIGDDEVLSQTNLGPTVVNTNAEVVGTINTGTWEADPVQIPYGGTGRSAITDNAILYKSATDPDVMQEVVSTTPGEVLQITDTGVPAYGIIDGGGWGA